MTPCVRKWGNDKPLKNIKRRIGTLTSCISGMILHYQTMIKHIVPLSLSAFFVHLYH